MLERLTNRRIATLVIGVTLMAGACGTDREITRPDPEPVTAENVQAALVTGDDLPEGWADTDEGSPLGTDIIEVHDCDAALADLEAEESASAAFTNGTATLTNTVAYFPGAGGQLDSIIREVAEDCDQVVVADEGIAVRTLGLDFGVLSDDVRAIKFEIEPDSGVIEERDLILVRDGNLVSVVRLDGPRPSDKLVLDAAVRTAIGRLGALANAAEGR